MAIDFMNWFPERETPFVLRRCRHDGCREEGLDCYTIDDFLAEPRRITTWLCSEHAAAAGFCVGCGCYSAGLNTFDFVHPGYCDTCWIGLDRDDVGDDW